MDLLFECKLTKFKAVPGIVEPGPLQVGGECAGGPEGEEQGADVAGDPGVDDPEELRPAAVPPLAPHRHDNPAAGAHHPEHLGEGSGRL